MICFNVVILTAVYPAELLKGRLKLIQKDGDYDVDNFRGIILLPSLSKIFEQLLLDQRHTYLKGLNIFVGDQFGFLKNFSCQMRRFNSFTRLSQNSERNLLHVCL